MDEVYGGGPRPQAGLMPRRSQVWPELRHMTLAKANFLGPRSSSMTGTEPPA